MTARDAGGIACRIFSLFVAMVAFRSLVTLLYSLRFMRYGYGPTLPMWFDFFIYGFGAVLLWVKASSFWPRDVEVASESNMDEIDWLRLSLIVLAAYFVLASAPVAFASFFANPEQSVNRFSSTDPLRVPIAWIQLVASLVVIAFAAMGWNKLSLGPDADESA